MGYNLIREKKNTFNIIMVILYVKPREKEGKEVNPRRAGGLDFPWSAGGGVFTPPRLTRLLSYVATCGRRRSKARPKLVRKYIGHF